MIAAVTFSDTAVHSAVLLLVACLLSSFSALHGTGLARIISEVLRCRFQRPRLAASSCLYSVLPSLPSFRSEAITRKLLFLLSVNCAMRSSDWAKCEY